MLVAALVACVTWPGPKDVERVDLAAASLPVVGLVGAYLSVTAILHLAIGARLRQGLEPAGKGNLLLFIDHIAVLLFVGKLSLHNPASPVYLTGSEVVLGVLAASALVSLTAIVLNWFFMSEAFSESDDEGSASASNRRNWTDRMLPLARWLHVAVTLGLLYFLWQLDLHPLLLVK